MLHSFEVLEGMISYSVGRTVNWHNFFKERFGHMCQKLSKGLCPLSRDFKKVIQCFMVYVCEKQDKCPTVGE